MQRLVDRAWGRLRVLGQGGGAVERAPEALAGHATPAALPGDFDALRYIALNPDLAHLADSPRQAEEHYVLYGWSERRPYKLDTDRLGQFPADFNEDAYVDLNPDLESLRGKPFAAADHYLASGRSEGRSYKVARQPGRTAEPSVESRYPLSDWRDGFKAGDFRALRPDLAGGGDTREALLAAFEARGIDAMAPLSFDLRFDPVFYAERYPEVEALAPAERYRRWLDEGVKAGRPASERDALVNLLGLPEYPPSFDWRRYAATSPRPASGPRTRLAALEYLVAVGLPRGDDVPVTGSSPGSFLLALSDAMWAAHRRRLAFELLRKALDADPSNGEVHHRMAQRCIDSEWMPLAERHELRALELGQTSVWAYTNLVDLASRRDDAAESYRLLAQCKARFEGLAPWRQALDEAVERDYAHTATRAWDLYHEGRREAADALMLEGLERVADALSTLDDLPARVGPTEDGHVVILANHVLPQCRHYRIEQRCRQLDCLGIRYALFDSQEAKGAREALVGARALIVYREPAFPATVRLLVHARAMGVPTFYDIDDLIFDSGHYPDGFETYEKQIGFGDYVGLLYGTPLIRFAISLCDAGLTSTTALSHHVAPLTIEGRCHVVPNGLDDRNARFLEASTRPRSGEGDDIIIFYGSGSQAHNRNFNETLGPALVAVMAAHPRVTLAVAGYLDLDPAFAPFAGRVRTFAFSKDLEAYWALLSEVDINLAVLTSGEMNDCKSEIKWLEAAVSGVPSVVSASARYREVIEDGIDGFLAGSSRAWEEALFRLVEDPDLRRRIGARARARALAGYSLDATAERLAFALGSCPRAPTRSRKRVLLVHVLFPPQSSGGATRVVRDNVDDLLDRYGDEFDLAVFTTDFDAPVPPSRVGHERAGASDVDPQDAPVASARGGGERGGADDPDAQSVAVASSRVGGYRGMPVFRVSRSSDSEFTYRDEAMGQRFAEVLRSWRPHVVHFHCIQFLTGSVVEACRRAGVPYLVTLHDAWWISPHQFLIDDDLLPRTPGPRALADGAGSIVEIDRRRYLGDQLGAAAAVLAVSESFADVYRRAGFPQTRAVPNGLSSLFLAPPARAGTGPERRVRVGHIGGLSHHKGCHLLRLALEVGDFAHIEAVVVDHAESAGHKRGVTWGSTPVLVRGPADQDGVRALYEGLDVLVAPSIWPESYGLVSREALAMGLWVIASDLGALGEDVVEGENGFVIDVKDARDLGRVLRLIDADPDRFRAPPKRAFVPRTAAAQTDDLVALYREFALPLAQP